MMVSREQWMQVLVTTGVRASVAVKWIDAFASRVQPSAFSLGLQEMDDFLAQVLHETGNLEHLEESLNYGAQRLQQVWPARFPSVGDAMRLAHNPEALANEVYGNRLGNVKWGDGWVYRGRGIPMVTGRENYALLESLTGVPLLEHPDRLAEPDTALLCGVLWWERKVPDSAIDSVDRVSRAVNGGTVGLQDRRDKYAAAHAAMEKLA